MHPVLIQQVADCRIQDLLREAAAARLAYQDRDARRIAARFRRARGDESEPKESASQPALV